MIGNLTIPETENLVRKEVLGRLACGQGDNIYVVPISYVYDGEYIYCHTREGLKIDIMRKQPKVCFEVDHLQNMASWQSAVITGTFEELTNPEERSQALKKLHERILPMPSSQTTHLSPEWPFPPEELNKIPGITFRIRPEKITGRFERPAASQLAGI